MIGVVANVFLIAAGYDIGKPSTQLIAQLNYQAEIEKAKEILARYKDRVVMPGSVAVRENNHRVEYPVTKIPEDTPVLDIGMDAIHDFVEVLKKSGTVVFNGPAGLFEDADFATGTYEMLKAASRVEFSVVGGGHTAAVIEKMGLDAGLHPHIHRWRGMYRVPDRKSAPCRGCARAVKKDIRITPIGFLFFQQCVHENFRNRFFPPLTGVGS